jgi:hypothetical protein
MTPEQARPGARVRAAPAAVISTKATIAASNPIFLNTLPPDLEGGQEAVLAILRLHRGINLPRNDYSIDPKRKTRLTQMS